MLECVVNISEGRDPAILHALDAAAGSALLDRHTDPHHHRSVFTLIGVDAVREVAALAIELIDLREHSGAHPRMGVVDVVPFIALDGSTPVDAVAARDAYARWSAEELGVPCFLYGDERSLPTVRRDAFRTLRPDVGAGRPHPTAGTTAVGQRPVMLAYNLWLAGSDLATAERLARSLRSPAVRALGLQVGDAVQVSMNLIAPHEVGPQQVYDAVAREAAVERAELVGLAPRSVLAAVPRHRWAELDLSDERTIEARLEHAGFAP
jgi:glutamate formiminotransferase / 5-formyltetrahydrofolate cyclo-ligase